MFTCPHTPASSDAEKCCTNNSGSSTSQSPEQHHCHHCLCGKHSLNQSIIIHHCSSASYSTVGCYHLSPCSIHHHHTSFQQPPPTGHNPLSPFMFVSIRLLFSQLFDYIRLVVIKLLLCFCPYGSVYLGEVARLASPAACCLNQQHSCSHTILSTEPKLGLFDYLQQIRQDPLTSLSSFVVQLLELCRVTQLYRTLVRMRERLSHWMRWRPTSSEELDIAESRCLSYLKCNYRSYYVDIGRGWKMDKVQMWTMEIPPNSYPNNDNTSPKHSSPLAERKFSSPPPPLPEDQGLPLVMMHGFASGVGLWSLNMDHFARFGNRHIFAFDLIGFGKSSRPNFNFKKSSGMSDFQKSKAEAEFMETCMVESVEKWRRAIGGPLQDKFILLGHSFGAYLALAYALRYPDHVAHIILADPWGMPQENQQRQMSTSKYSGVRMMPFWLRGIAKLVFHYFNPLAGLRAAGPFGPTLIHALRPDLKQKFQRLTSPLNNNESELAELNESDTSDVSEEDSCFVDYIYHCNAQSSPTGEIAFKKICTSTGWARLPMLERIIELECHITLSFIYGSRSWIDRQSGFQAKYILATAANAAAASGGGGGGYEDDEVEDVERVDVHVLDGAGHHVYADRSDEFNELVMKICAHIDGQYGLANTEQFEEDDSFLQQQRQQQQQQPENQYSDSESSPPVPILQRPRQRNLARKF